jgi:hypothetical protein
VKNNIDHSNFTLPEQNNFEQAYKLSLLLAVNKLSATNDFESLSQKIGSIFKIKQSKPIISLQYLNHDYEISFPEIIVTRSDNSQPVELTDKILILHYLLQSKGTLLSNNLVSFQELKEGATYYPSFVKRSVRPIIDFFGRSPERLIEISREFGGFIKDIGDYSVTIPAFPRLPVTYVVWKGDEEFPPNANILFDESVLDYLPAEDVTVLCQNITWRLVKSLK